MPGGNRASVPANPDNLAIKIAELVKDGKISGIADLRDETSGRTGQRLVIVLKRDAVAKVVLNNLYKHTQLQDNFSANMLAIVDGVPRTLSLDAFIRHWVAHQMDVIARRTRYRLRKAEEEAHILRALLKALDMLDEVIALIRASNTTEAAREGLMELLEIDELQARAILDMQLRRLAALERQKIQDRHSELESMIEEYNSILASEERQRQIISEELAEIVAKHGDDRRTHILMGFDGDMSMEDLIPRRGNGCHHHPWRLRKAHPQRQLPFAAAWRQGHQGRTVAWRRRGGALLRHHHAPLVAVLYQPWTRVPGKGLRTGRSRPRCQGPARCQLAGVPAG